MNRNISASVLAAAVGLLLSTSALAQESKDENRRAVMPGTSRPVQKQPAVRESRPATKPLSSVPSRRQEAPASRPQATPVERRQPESAPKPRPSDSLPRERKSVTPQSPQSRTPSQRSEPKQTPAPSPSQPRQAPKVAPSQPRQVPSQGPSQPRERRTITPPSDSSKLIGPTPAPTQRGNERNAPPEMRVPSKGPRLATPTPRKELLDMARPPSNERGSGGSGRSPNVRFPDAPEVRDPNRRDDRDWDRDHDRDYGRDRGHDRDWDHGRRRWDRWDDGCWRRPVVYVPRRSHIVLGWGWGCDDSWYWRPSYGWCRRSVWCDPYDNLIVTTCAPSWRYRWSSYSGFGFSYSSRYDSFSLGVAYAPLAVPVYTSCAPVYGSAVLWDRPTVIVGGTRWFPGTYVNNTTIIGTGSGVYDPNLNPGLATASNLTLPTLPAAQDDAPVSATELDRAVEAMHAERYDAAVDWLRAYVRENPSDGKAMRWLSVALLSARNPDDAAAMMRMAYSTDIGLAGEPLNRFELGLNQTELRDLVVRASIYANAHDTGSSWLLLGVLMQAEGRVNLAGEQFDKAAAAGCDPAIIERLKAVSQ
jgi:hypothetical protein